MQYSKQWVLATLRRTGYEELADEAERALPDPVDVTQLEVFANSHGVSREDIISELGGSQ